MQKVIFKSDTNAFYSALRHNVEQYFEEKKMSKTGNWHLFTKTIVFLSAAVGLYVWLVFFTPSSVLLSLLLCGIAGTNMAFIGFNVMHDASHGSYSESPKLSNALSYTMNLLGSSAFFWNTKHNILHHTFTNIDGVDADIVQTKLLRLAPSQEWRPVHRFQHIYSLPLYAISHAVWIFFNDFEKYFSKKVLNMPIRNFDLRQHIIFWTTKVLYTTVYIVIPAIVVGFWPAIIGFAVMSAVCGITITVVFQLAHVVEITEFEDGSEGIEVESEWAVHQLNTTANFATHSSLLSWFLGGLNFQVEHHLFPKISHIHYPALQKIVRKTCEQYNVRYRSFPTLFQAINSHFRMLYLMGNNKITASAR